MNKMYQRKYQKFFNETVNAFNNADKGGKCELAYNLAKEMYEHPGYSAGAFVYDMMESEETPLELRTLLKEYGKDWEYFYDRLDAGY